MRKVIIGVVVMLVLILGAYFYFFKFNVSSKVNAINVIPKSAVFILDIEDPFNEWNKVTQGEVWGYLKTNEHFFSIGNSIDSLNSGFKENQLIWDLVASRPVMVSAHIIRNDEFDYLFAVDLSKASRFSFIKDYLENLVGDNLDVTKRTYHEIEIIELDFKDSNQLMYLYIEKNLIVISTTHVLIENSIDQLNEPIIGRDLDYLEVSRQMEDVGVNIYLQHAYFKKYLNQWMKDEKSNGYEFIESLVYSGVNIKIEDRFISLSGYSNLKDSINSFAHAVHDSGAGEIELADIVPESSLFFLSIGFNSFSEFYTNIEKSIASGEDGVDYFKDKEKLEKYLDISVEGNLLSWIGDEIGVMQIHSSGTSKPSEYAFVLKANDIDKAKENLAIIKTQIKKNTPVKFKGIEYKDHQINFLSVKGLFKILLGNIFSKLDKPYYTIIDDFVIFSNHPGTLAQIISYKLEGKTLSTNDRYIAFRNQFEDEASLFFYINSKQIVPASKEHLSTDYWDLLNMNKKYIESFPIIGLQIKPEGKLMATSIILNYMPQQDINDWNQLFLPLASFDLDATLTDKPQPEEQISIDDIFPDDLNDKKLTDTFKNGQLKFEASLKDGLKSGSYLEYDSLGNVIVKGRYKKNEKAGTWKYYDSDGNMIWKEKY